MVSNFQDDDRENAMRDLFSLYKDEEEGRSGIDAFMDFQGKKVPFELKTTSNGSVTTVRDFGPDHVAKWKDKHWLIGFFIGGDEYYKYGSPSMMAPWIKGKEDYISPDFKLAELVPSKLGYEDLYAILEEKDKFTLEDAKSIQKKQYKIAKYRSLQDLDNGYSPGRMLEILKDRSRYLIERGSTLNNPHIPGSYFNGWVKIVENHTEQLKSMVSKYFEESAD